MLTDVSTTCGERSEVYSIYSLELRYSKLSSSDFLSMLWCSNNVIIPTLQSRNTQCSVRFTAYFSQSHFVHLLLLTMHLDGSPLLETSETCSAPSETYVDFHAKGATGAKEIKKLILYSGWFKIQRSAGVQHAPKLWHAREAEHTMKGQSVKIALKQDVWRTV